HQFDPADRTVVHIDTRKAVWDVAETGVAMLQLYADHREAVIMERWAPAVERFLDASGGLELLVIEGTLRVGMDSLRKWDWLRLPVGSDFQATAGPEGALVWVKTGHLRDIGAVAQ
ncbi:MAG: cupin, partial [Loktanella sp.]|nr:cupin [Loktanella sp.]